MRERVDQLGVSEPEIQRSGRDQIAVGLPDVKNAERAQRQVGTRRPAVLLRLGGERPRRGPQARSRTTRTSHGGPQAGQVGGLSLYDAVKRASQAPAESTTTTTPSNDQYYLFGPAPHHRLLRRPRGERGRPRLRAAAAAQAARTARSCKVNTGTTSSRRRSPTTRPRARPTPTTSSTTTRRSAAPTSRTPSRTSTRAPAARARRSSRSSSRTSGRKKWQDVTRRDRPARPRAAGARASRRRPSFQHFARGAGRRGDHGPVHLLHRQPGRHRRPPGLADRGRVHDLHGAGPRAAAQDGRPAGQARADLAVAGLGDAGPARRSTRACIAGGVGFALVVLFLLVFYRVLGRDRRGGAGRLRALLLRADQADPDHADPAGHRGPDPDDRRRGRREHRHLRTRQGGDPRRARRSSAASRRATRRGSRRSSTPTSSR